MQTSNYSTFKLLSTNRSINENNVLKIMDSIKQWGVIPGRPVLVDEMYFIVDGQHRFEAMKRLGLPIAYEIIKGDIIAKTMALNSNQSPWKIIDYIKSYAEQGVDCYRLFLKFNEKYNIPLETTLSIYIKRSLKGTDIRKGKIFDIPQDAETIAEFITSLDNKTLVNSKNFAMAVIKANKLLTKQQMDLIRLNSMKIPKFSNANDFLVSFENIVNHRKRGENIVKLT